MERKRYTVEAEFSENTGSKHRTRAFKTLEKAHDYARWAHNRAMFDWALLRYKHRPIEVWAEGKLQYSNYCEQ